MTERAQLARVSRYIGTIENVWPNGIVAGLRVPWLRVDDAVVELTLQPGALIAFDNRAEPAAVSA